MKLLVVAGHGRLPSGVMDNGASGHGYNEAERVRALASRMKALGGASVVVGDTTKNWYGYKTFQSFNAAGYDAVIELHLDSASSASAKGGHVIIKLGFGADKWDKALAKFINGYFPGRSTIIDGRNNLQNVNICANRGINYRLLENCFISNYNDITKFNKNIDEVAKGILKSFGISVSGGSTKPATPSDPDGAIRSGGVSQASKDRVGKITYRVHMRGIGDGAKVSDGAMAGSTGQNRRIEGIYIWPVGQMDVTAHMKGIGDKKYSNITGNTLIGTKNEKRRIEAIMIESKDTIYAYRVHRKGEGWTEWKMNGQWVGVKGVGTQIEAIEIRVVYIRYQAHVQDLGWMGFVPDGVPAGTTNRAKRMEALKIDPMGLDIEAWAHIQNIGWVYYGKITKETVIGTTSKSLRLECLKFKGDFEFRVHIQNIGWTAWTKADGIATMGTVGQALRIEAIEIRLAA